MQTIFVFNAIHAKEKAENRQQMCVWGGGPQLISRLQSPSEDDISAKGNHCSALLRRTPPPYFLGKPCL